MNLEIITKKETDRTDPVFYYGKEIAKIKKTNGNQLVLESRGELEILTDDGKMVGVNALEWLKDNEHNDITINDLYDDDCVDLSNWFCVIETDPNGEIIGDDICLDGNYDDALSSLKEVYKES